MYAYFWGAIRNGWQPNFFYSACVTITYGCEYSADRRKPGQAPFRMQTRTNVGHGGDIIHMNVYPKLQNTPKHRLF